MTSEIVILNRSAIALAADSAATIGSEKTFLSSNKIFTLSKKEPIGVMLYGNASFMDVPWEVLIKLYRKELGDQSFMSLEEYEDNFRLFLANLVGSFEENELDQFTFNLISTFIHGLLEISSERIEDEIDENQDVDDDRIRELTTETFQDGLEILRSSEDLEGFESAIQDNIINNLDDITENVISNFAQDHILFSN